MSTVAKLERNLSMWIVRECTGLRAARCAWVRKGVGRTVNLAWTSDREITRTMEQVEVLIASIRRLTTSFHPRTSASSSLRRDRMAVCIHLRMSTTTRLTSRIWIQMWRDPIRIKPPSQRPATNAAARADPNPSARRTSTRRTTCSRRWSWKTRPKTCADRNSAATPRSTSKWWAAVTMAAPALSAAAIKLSPRKAHQASGPQKEMSNSWAWTETLTLRHPNAQATKWSWTKAWSTQFRSSLSQAESTSSNVTLSVKITKTYRIARVRRALITQWVSSSRRQISTSSRPGRSRTRTMEAFQRLACQAAPTITKSIGSALKSRLARI